MARWRASTSGSLGLGREAAALVTSQLAVVEVIRATRRRLGPAGIPTARGLLTRVDLVPLTQGIIDVAADVGDPSLRSLDAIHLASALAVREALEGLVAYDDRLGAAADAACLAWITPGR